MHDSIFSETNTAAIIFKKSDFESAYATSY